MKVNLFITCLTDTLYPQTGIAMVKLLERLGCEVEFPRAQTCCGQMHLNTGYQPEALELIRNMVTVFEQAEIVVAPSGSCVAMIRELSVRAAEWSDDDLLLERVKNLASRTFELSEFLVKKLGLEDVGAYYPHRVTYHPTCHAIRVLEVGDAPLKLLRNVRGLQLVPLEDANQCCGFGGTFAVKNAETSTAMLADKMRNISNTRAEVCTAGDNSCLMHIGGGLHRLQTGVRTVHLAEILANTEGDA
jgi:L-lactate dehydrogenase complex protein LldE